MAFDLYRSYVCASWTIIEQLIFLSQLLWSRTSQRGGVQNIAIIEWKNEILVVLALKYLNFQME